MCIRDSANRLISNLAGVFDHIALGIQIHVGLCCCRSFLAIVEKMRAAIGHANQHESTAAQISRRRMHHRQRESRSHRCIDRIAAGLHDLDSRPRGQLVNADHDSMLRVHRLLSLIHI